MRDAARMKSIAVPFLDAGHARRRAWHACPAGLAAMLLACGAAAADGLGQAEMDAGRKLFTAGAAPACAVCHTLQDAGATGAVGPDLDALKPDAARVEAAVRNGLGVMPAFDALSDDEVRILSRYVAAATGAP